MLSDDHSEDKYLRSGRNCFCFYAKIGLKYKRKFKLPENSSVLVLKPLIACHLPAKEKEKIKILLT